MSHCPSLVRPHDEPLDIEELCSHESTKPKSLHGSQELKNPHDLLQTIANASVVALCTCQQSKDFPYCDNTHTAFNKATNSTLSPLYVAFVEGDKCSSCGSSLKHNSKRLSLSLSHSPSSSSMGNCCNGSPHSSLNSVNDINPPIRPTYSKSKLSLSTPSFDNHYLNPDRPRAYTSTSTPLLTTYSTKDNKPQQKDKQQTDPQQTYPQQKDKPQQKQYKDYQTITHQLDKQQERDKQQKGQNKDKQTITRSTPQPKRDLSPSTTQVNAPSSKYKPGSTNSRNNKNVITSAEVALHNTEDDLWMIINGRVYNITDYTLDHPGGKRALVKFAGRDGSENVEFHSSKMLEILNSKYFIGNLPKHEGGPSGCTIC